MSFLDKAKEKATQLTHQAKEKFEDIKETRKVDDLLADLGRITYRQHTERSEDADAADIATVVRKLQDLEAEGADVLPKPAVDESADTSAPTAAPSAPPPFEPPTI